VGHGVMPNPHFSHAMVPAPVQEADRAGVARNAVNPPVRKDLDLQKPRNFGRYGGSSASAPPTGLGVAPSVKVRTKVGTVDDPMEAREKHLATINRDVDVLETEHSHRRIDHAAYRAGRALKRAYERLPAAASGTTWRGGDRVDPVAARDAFVDRLDDAVRAVAAIEERARHVIGASGVVFLARILRDNWTFAELAARGEARGSRADVARIADRFRWLLAELADGWAARGNER